MIHYRCRHCHVHLGSVQDTVDAGRLGWKVLSQKERSEFLAIQKNGDMVVKSICEDCEKSLELSPNLHSVSNMIQ